MNDSCEFTKRPSVLTVLATPLFLGILFLLFMLVLNHIVSSPLLNGVLVSTAVVAAAAAPVVLLGLRVRISIEGSKPKYSLYRTIAIFGRVVTRQLIARVDDVFWKRHYGESGGMWYEIYGRIRPENGGLEDIRDVPVLGFWSLIVTLKKPDVDAFRTAFRELQRGESTGEPDREKPPPESRPEASSGHG